MGLPLYLANVPLLRGGWEQDYLGPSLIPSPPLPLTNRLQKRWSGIFGPIPWLASTHLEYFWSIRLPLDHVPTKLSVSLVREDIGE